MTRLRGLLPVDTERVCPSCKGRMMKVVTPWYLRPASVLAHGHGAACQCWECGMIVFSTRVEPTQPASQVSRAR